MQQLLIYTYYWPTFTGKTDPNIIQESRCQGTTPFRWREPGQRLPKMIGSNQGLDALPYQRVNFQR